MAGIEMTHVPIAAPPAMNDLIPGRMSMMFNTAGDESRVRVRQRACAWG